MCNVYNHVPPQPAYSTYYILHIIHIDLYWSLYILNINSKIKMKSRCVQDLLIFPRVSGSLAYECFFNYILSDFFTLVGWQFFYTFILLETVIIAPDFCSGGRRLFGFVSAILCMTYDSLFLYFFRRFRNSRTQDFIEHISISFLLEFIFNIYNHCTIYQLVYAVEWLVLFNYHAL